MTLALDTKAYVAFRNGHLQTAELVRDAEAITMSVVVVGELLFGFHHGNRYERNRMLLEEFLGMADVSVVPVTESTADRFGLLSASLRRRGTPIPTNDIWIAAHVFESGTRLATFDKHFQAIDNLPQVTLTR